VVIVLVMLLAPGGVLGLLRRGYERLLRRRRGRSSSGSGPGDVLPAELETVTDSVEPPIPTGPVT
jgi:hypothetical protein